MSDSLVQVLEGLECGSCRRAPLEGIDGVDTKPSTVLFTLAAFALGIAYAKYRWRKRRRHA